MDIKSGLSSHSKNTVQINKVKKDVPFSTRYYNRPSVVTSTDSLSVTDQQYKEITDINVIVAKHSSAGVPLPSIDGAVYNLTSDLDVSNVEAIGSNVNFVDRYLKAKASFLNLPSALRLKFNNDVAQFCDYLSTSSDSDVSKLLKSFNVIKEDVSPSVDVHSSIPSTLNDDNTSSVSPEG